MISHSLRGSVDQDIVNQIRCSVHVYQEIIMLNLNKDCERKNRTLCAECMEDKELKSLCPINKLSARVQEYRSKKEQELQEQSLIEQQKLDNLIKSITTLKEKIDQRLENWISECQQLQQWLKKQLKDQASYYDNISSDLCKKKLDDLAEILGGHEQKTFGFAHLCNKYSELLTEAQFYSRKIASDFSEIFMILERNIKPKQQLTKSLQQVWLSSIDQQLSCLAQNHKKSLVFGGWDKFIQIWEREGVNLKKSAVLSGHKGLVTTVAIYKSDDILISGSIDQTLKLWQIANNSRYCFQTLNGHSGQINEIRISQNEEQVFSASSDKTIKVWQRVKQSNNLELVQTIAESYDVVQNIALSESYLALSTTWASWKHYVILLKLVEGKWKKIDTKATQDRYNSLHLTNYGLICQQKQPAKIIIYAILDVLLFFKEIPLQQFELEKQLEFPIIQIQKTFLLKNSQTLVMLQINEEYDYVIEQIINKNLSFGCADAFGNYILLVNNQEKKIEIYNIS